MSGGVFGVTAGGTIPSNSSPVLGQITDQSVGEGTTLKFTAIASDPDTGETLTYSLDPGAPGGASIDAASGVFTWTPTEEQGPGSYPITVRVTDNGSPPLSATTSFTVKVLGDTSIQVGASSSSPTYGQAMTFSAVVTPVTAGAPTTTGTVQFEIDGTDLGSPIALSNGSAVSIGVPSLPAGLHVITAVYSGDGNFVNQSAELSETVGQAPLTITADSETKLYGAGLPTLTASYSGFVNGDTIASLTTPPALATTATAARHAGIYGITASGASDPNYVISYLPGTLTVTPAPLTITSDDKTKFYGQANPAFSVSYAGLVNGDTPSSLSGTLNYTTSASATSAAGPYPIAPSGLTSSDYAIAYASGTLTISAAPTVTSLSSSASTAYLDQSVTFTAVVAVDASQAPGDPATPTGTVGFYDGSTLLGSAPLGVSSG
jgi:hypothetical protein